MSKQHKGTIQNWYVMGKLVVGNLFNDPTERFPDGAFIHTSDIVKIDEENALLETNNSIYSLGVKDVKAQESYDELIKLVEEK